MLRVATVCTFMGWGLLHFFGETHYSALLWDEEWLGGWVGDWTAFSNETASAQRIRWMTVGIGGYLFLSAVVSLFVKRITRLVGMFLVGGVLILFLLAFIAFKERFYEIPQLLEYSSQWMCPLLFLYFARNGKDGFLVRWMRIALVFTFAGHGVYALGILPLPVHFMEMTMGILHLTEDAALFFLKVAGFLDMLACVLLCSKNKKWMAAGLYYMVCWGFLTALARTVYVMELECTPEQFAQHFPRTLLRLGHGLLPLYLMMDNHAGQPIQR